MRQGVFHEHRHTMVGSVPVGGADDCSIRNTGPLRHTNVRFSRGRSADSAKGASSVQSVPSCVLIGFGRFRHVFSSGLVGSVMYSHRVQSALRPDAWTNLSGYAQRLQIPFWSVEEGEIAEVTSRTARQLGVATAITGGPYTYRDGAV